MLRNRDAATNIPVKDLEVARKFYTDTLGLEQTGSESGEVLSFRSGGSTILVYRSGYAGTNQATAMTWTLDGEVEQTVQDLKSRGVRFEHYDMPGMTREGDIHVCEGLKVAWFKDPDGNILSLAGS